MDKTEDQAYELWLPREVFGYIFSFVYQKQDLQAIRCTCKEYKKIVTELLAYRKKLNGKKTGLFNKHIADCQKNITWTEPGVSGAFARARNIYAIHTRFSPDQGRIVLYDVDNSLIFKHDEHDFVEIIRVGIGNLVFNHGITAYVQSSPEPEAIVNLESGDKVPLNTERLGTFAFSYDDSLLADKHENHINVYNTKTGHCIAMLSCTNGACVRMKFHPTKPLLLTTTAPRTGQYDPAGNNGVNSRMVAWNLDHLQEKQEWQEGPMYTGKYRGSWVISPCDSRCAILLDNKIYQWEITLGECKSLPTIKLVGDIGKRMQYSSDGSKLFIKREKRFIGQSSSLVVYDLQSERQLDLSGNPFIPGLYAFYQYHKVGPRGSLASSGSRLYDLSALQKLEYSVDSIE